MQSYVAPKTQVVFRLQNGLYRIVEVTPNTNISIPKYGSFPANLILGRPFYLTYELWDKHSGDVKTTGLRVVSPAELHAEALSQDNLTPAESRDEKATETPAEDAFDLVTDDGQVLIRNNRLTVDDPSRQALSMDEIEELKKAGTGSGKEIIAKIMAAHSALNEKTQFSLAKYTLRKSKKYMRRFTVLPLDAGILSKIWLEKDPSRVMELREEMLGLIMSWGNVHHAADAEDSGRNDDQPQVKRGRYLVIDDSSGLVVAALADRMGILYHSEAGAEESPSNNMAKEDIVHEDTDMADAPSVEQQPTGPGAQPQNDSTLSKQNNEDRIHLKSKPGAWPHKRPYQSTAKSNIMTVLHANTQPNLSLLESFGYDPDKPIPTHPLYAHLRTITWLQLLDPSSDTLYQEPPPPEPASAEEAKLPLSQRLTNMKSGKRSAYWKKRKRWERVKTIVDETREGGFDSLIVASTMDPVDILKHCVPLVRGGGNVVIYSPSVEPLIQVMDLYSRDRRAGYVKIQQKADVEGKKAVVNEEDFPVDPTLLLNPMLQTARAREWQVLPMRTHPLMTGRGGSEGYLFTATRVVPIKGVRIEAKGKFGKKRKADNQVDKNGIKKVTVESDEEVEGPKHAAKKAAVFEVDSTTPKREEREQDARAVEENANVDMSDA